MKRYCNRLLTVSTSLIGLLLLLGTSACSQSPVPFSSDDTQATEIITQPRTVAQDTPPETFQTSDLAAISERFVEALQNNDFSSLTDIYASDAVILDFVTDRGDRINDQPSLSLEELTRIFGNSEELPAATLKENATFVALSENNEVASLQFQIMVNDSQYYSVMYLQGGKIIFQVVGIADNYPLREVIQSEISSQYSYQNQPIYLSVLGELRNAAAECPPLETGTAGDTTITDEQLSEYRSCMEGVYVGDDQVFAQNGIVNRAVENANPLTSTPSEDAVDVWQSYLGNAKRNIPAPYMLRYHETSTENLGFIVYEGVFSNSFDPSLTEVGNNTESGFPVYNLLVVDNNQIIANVSDGIYLRPPQ